MASIFGISDEAFVKATGMTFNDVVEAFANETIEDLRESLRSKVKLTTSKQLEQSIVAMPVEVNGKTITVEILAEEYWNYLNKGVQGIGGEGWTKKNTTSPFSYKKGDENKPSPKHFIQWANLAGKSPFAVAETVYRAGTKGNQFFDEVVDDQFEQKFADFFMEKLARTVELDLKLDFDGK